MAFGVQALDIEAGWGGGREGARLGEGSVCVSQGHQALQENCQVHWGPKQHIGCNGIDFSHDFLSKLLRALLIA